MTKGIGYVVDASGALSPIRVPRIAARTLERFSTFKAYAQFRLLRDLRAQGVVGSNNEPIDVEIAEDTRIIEGRAHRRLVVDDALGVRTTIYVLCV